jgi:hypothetical protein
MAAVEQKKSYQVIKQFEGLNTKANRTAINENQFSWLENLMPIGYANLKSMSGPRTVPNGPFSGNVVSMFGANINNIDYLIAFKANGSCDFVNLATEVTGTIKPSGFFSASGINVSQWKNTEVLILDPVKGYFTWNGTNVVAVGSVGAIFITNGGSGYTSAPTVTISAPNDANGVRATATCTTTANVVTSISLTEAGSGYTVAPTVTFTGGGGTNAAAIAGIVDFKTGTVSALVTNGGSGYTNAANTVVTISGGGGTNAAATAVLAGGRVNAVVITNPGQNYTNVSNLSITISGGGGANAVVKGIVNDQLNTGIASFSGRVWIANGRNISYSAAGSVSDFVTVSAGTIVLTDSTLRGNIVQILSANNFLYIFGQDSINVFSDVRVTGTGVTLFTNTNISASVGTKFDYAIFPYFRSVLFMNDYGVYALVGSTTSKLSDPLDGIFQYIDFATSTVTAGQVLINNILCAAFNIKYNDTNDQYGYKYLQAVFFEKKWFFTSQGRDLKTMVSIPVNGQPRLYATNGVNLQQLYADPDTAVFSRVQTALMPMGDPIRTKQALKFAIEATLNTTGTTLDVTVDSEKQQSESYILSNGIDWLNNGGQVITWTNDTLDTISWAGGTGYTLYKSDAQQWGKYLGLTVETTSKSYVLSGFEFEHELRVRF